MSSRKDQPRPKYRRYAEQGRREQNKQRRIDTIDRYIARRAAKR